MTEFFRFTIELEAQIHDAPVGVGKREVFERVRRLAQRIAQDKQMLTEVYKITFLDLLLGDYYSETLHSRLKLKKEGEIILPLLTGLESQDASFFTKLFTEPLGEDSGKTRDNAMNLLFSQFGNPVITAARLEYGNTDMETADKKAGIL